MLGQADIEEPYLRVITKTYAKWWQLYTLTGAQTNAQQEPSPFDFGLMVQTGGVRGFLVWSDRQTEKGRLTLNIDP